HASTPRSTLTPSVRTSMIGERRRLPRASALLLTRWFEVGGVAANELVESRHLQHGGVAGVAGLGGLHPAFLGAGAYGVHHRLCFGCERVAHARQLRGSHPTEHLARVRRDAFTTAADGS